jgi:hypothetical protein
MGMGTFAGYAYVAQDSWFEEMGLNALRLTIESKIEEYEGCPKDLFDEPESADSDEEKELVALYDELQSKFYEKTGLEVFYEYHNPEDGDRYDEVSESYWSLEGVEQFTPAAEAVKDKFDKCFFTTFG